MRLDGPIGISKLSKLFGLEEDSRRLDNSDMYTQFGTSCPEPLVVVGIHVPRLFENVL